MLIDILIILFIINCLIYLLVPKFYKNKKVEEKEKVEEIEKFKKEKIEKIEKLEKVEEFKKEKVEKIEKIRKFNEFDILRTKKIFTNNELYFFLELKNFLKNTNYNLFTKVRLADIVESKTGISYGYFVKVFNRINRKHIDFLICDNYGNIKLGIELDGYSHNYKKTIESDKIKNNLFESINIPLIRFNNSKNYNLEKLKNLL